MVPNTNSSRDDEVHFSNFLLFIVDNVLLKLVAKMSRCQSEGNIIQKLSAYVLLGVEENPEVEKYIVKQIVHDQSTFDASRQH